MLQAAMVLWSGLAWLQNKNKNNCLSVLHFCCTEIIPGGLAGSYDLTVVVYCIARCTKVWLMVSIFIFYLLGVSCQL